jgi:sugar O-acyltransferase (sialic acid O-acetyltransferase NeuD family)
LKGEPLLIFPCNGNGIEALDCIGEAYEVLGFIDDSADKQGAEVHGYPVFDRGALTRFEKARVLAVPGSPTSYLNRRQAIEGLGIDGERFARVVHPCTHVSPRAKLGLNVLVMAGVVITSNAVVGDHVCILPNTVVHHDCVIGAWTLIGSSVTIAGAVRVGRNCYIGSGASIMNGVTVGDEALVGLGANVIRNVPAAVKVAGNPARLI